MLVTIISALTIFMCFINEDSTVVVDGKQIEPITFQKTYNSTLASAEINADENDNIDKSLIASNDVITVDLKVLVDNKELNIKSTEKNIALMLKAEKIALSATDKVSPSLVTELSSGMEVTVTRVKIATLKKSIPIPFKTVIKNDANTLKSQSKVSQVGKQGEKSVTSNVTYEDGKQVASNVIKETVIKAPQNKIIVQGTLPNITFSRGGSEKIINVKATAYCPIKGATNTYTASGKKAVRDPNGISTIATDPNVIPMGTKLYVEGYGYAIAADKGSGVKGKFIDLYFNTLKEALDFGVRYIKVQILD
ncbi:G5 domain-containing protein [Clostridium estertheticum]|uniref:G5 domain-containing protein n=1 Tax=Clostridium estertheticum TaxID=238834 RepID=UPI0013E94236|nr:G5 domain-containing protein [Clostridium estertheticum]MBZ9686374.1 G5 domain-containing protein [Clostridium estertheticum]